MENKKYSADTRYICTLKRKERNGGMNMKRYTSTEMKTAYEKGGYRERYAMENGNKAIVYVNGHKCFKFTYSSRKEYQDANGALYDTVTKSWRG